LVNLVVIAELVDQIEGNETKDRSCSKLFIIVGHETHKLGLLSDSKLIRELISYRLKIE